MITSVPLPTIAGLFGGFLNPTQTDQDLGASWRQEGDTSIWFSRSAWSLSAIARWWSKCHNGECPVVWLPDYFCNESTGPLRETGAQIHFYPIDASLNPEWQKCQDQALEAPPDLFVLVHYFGRAGESSKAKSFCDKMGALLVEDAAHVLRPTAEIGLHSDFTFYSPHKLLAIPEGGVLAIRNKNIALEMEDVIAEMLTQASDKFRKASFGNITAGRTSFPVIWIFKRLMQIVLPLTIARRLSKQGNLNYLEDPSPTQFQEPPFLRDYGRRLITSDATSLDDVATHRKSNARALRSIFENQPDCRPLFSDQEERDAPYRFVLRFDYDEHAQKLFEKGQSHGFPVESWPDLPPEVSANSESHKVAGKLRRTLVLLPVHQTLNSAEIASICTLADSP